MMTNNVEETIKEFESISGEADDNLNSESHVTSAILLRKAIERFDANEVEELLKKGCDVEHMILDDRRLHNAIHVLVVTYTSCDRQNRPNQPHIKFVDILMLFLQHFVDINRKDVSKQTALHLVASKQGNSDIIKVLISHGADLNSLDNLSQTPLHKAALCGTLYDVKALVDGDAKVDIMDVCGHSPLHMACKRKNGSEVVDMLIKNGAKINIRNANKRNEGLSPLHVACRHGNLHTVVRLLKAGCRVDIRDTSGQTCAHIAAAHDVTGKILQELVKHQADVNSQDSLFKDTPLHKAVKNNMFDNIKSLIIANANPAIPDCHGESALHLAAGGLRDIQCWVLLLRTGVSTQCKNIDRQTPLDKALRNRNAVAVNMIQQFQVVASPKMAASPRLAHRPSFHL